MLDTDFRPDPETFNGLLDEGGAILTDPDAERTLIGLLLQDPDQVERVGDKLHENDLCDILHRRIFEKMRRLYDIGAEVKIGALVEALGGDPTVKIDGERTVAQYLAGMLAEADTSFDPIDLADYLASVSERRATSIAQDADLIREPFQSKFGLVMWADQNDAGPEYDFIVEDLVPEAEPVLIYGESQTGKSFFTSGLGLAVARGVPFFGHRILEPRWVIYGAWEAGSGWRGRMRAYAKANGLVIEDLPFGALTQPIDIASDATNVDKIIEEIKAIEREKFRGFKPGLFVIDTYNAATPGASEINSEEVSRIRQSILRICKETGAAVPIVTHKNQSGRIRGNEQLYNNLPTAIDISMKVKVVGKEIIAQNDDDGRALRTARVRKQREGLAGEEWEFVLHVVETGSTNKFGKPRTSCVVGPPNIATVSDRPDDRGSKDDGIGVRVSKQIQSFMGCIMRALDERGVSPPPELGLPRSISKVVDWDYVKRVFAQQMPNDYDENDEGRKKHREAAKRAVTRAREALMHTKVIGINSPFVWWTGKPVNGVRDTYPRSQNSFFDQGDPGPDSDDLKDLY